MFLMNSGKSFIYDQFRLTIINIFQNKKTNNNTLLKKKLYSSYLNKIKNLKLV